MKVAILDFTAVTRFLSPRSVNTRSFEIYYDIARLLDINITKEACFKLFTKHAYNYGKLKEYLCILGNNPDKHKFDEEFFRRYKQIYFNEELAALNEKKQELHQILANLTEDHLIGMVAIGNIEFINFTLFQLEMGKYIHTLKTSEYLQDYDRLVDEILAENVVPSHPPEALAFILTDAQEYIGQFFTTDARYKTFNIELTYAGLQPQVHTN